MIENVPLIQDANDAKQINTSLIALKRVNKELDDKILILNKLNNELDKKIVILNNELNQEITDRENADSAEVENRNTAITNAVNALDVASVGGSGKYISAISETDGKISATVSDLTSVIQTGNTQPATSGGVADAIQDVVDVSSSLPTDAVLHYSFDDVPDYPDGTADVRLIDNNTYDIQSTDYKFNNNTGATFSNNNGKLEIVTVSTGFANGAHISNTFSNGKIVKIKFKVVSITNNGTVGLYNGTSNNILSANKVGTYEASFINTNDSTHKSIYLFTSSGSTSDVILDEIYIGNGSYSTPIIDNANGQNNATNNGGIAVKGVSGKGVQFLQSSNAYINANNKPLDGLDSWTLSFWLNLNRGVEATSKNPRLYQFGYLDYCFCDGFYIGGNAANFNFATYKDNSHRIFATVNMSQYIGQTIFVTVETEIDTESTSTKRVYINGVLKTQATGSIIEKPTYSSWSIGGNVSNQHLENTMIDDFQIFNRALSEKEIVALYQNKANTPKYYNINNYNLKQIKDITAQSTDFADFQSRMAGLATRSLQLIEPTEDER